MRIREDLQQVWAPDSPPRSPVWTMDRIGVSFLDPLDDYELIHRIGSGTYGDVFKVSESPSHLIVNATGGFWVDEQTATKKLPPILTSCLSWRWCRFCRSLAVIATSGGPRFNFSSTAFPAMRSAVWCGISCWSLGLAELRALRCNISGARLLAALEKWRRTFKT